MLRFIFFRQIKKKKKERKWSWRNAHAWLILTFSKITKGCLSQEIFRKSKLRSVSFTGNLFTLKIFKTDRRSKNQPLAVIQPRIKCKSHLNSMKTQKMPYKRSERCKLKDQIMENHTWSVIWEGLRIHLAWRRNQKCHGPALHILPAAAELAQHGQVLCSGTSSDMFIGESSVLQWEMNMLSALKEIKHPLHWAVAHKYHARCSLTCN